MKVELIKVEKIKKMIKIYKNNNYIESIKNRKVKNPSN